MSFLRRWVFANSLVAGFFALCWLLLRSGTKPNRFAYPCQQAALSTATLAFGVPLVSALITARRRLATAVRTPVGATVGTTGLLLTAGIWGFLSRANSYQGPVLEPPAEYRASVFHVPNCPQDPVGDRFHGLDALLANMGRDGLKFFDSATATLTAGPDGIIAANDVVVIKINYQWSERGGTNTDVLRGLIRRIVDHPDGFTGEIAVCENAQFASTNGFDRAYNNAQDTGQSPLDVVTDFQSQGYTVSLYDWTEIRFDSVGEYDEGDMNDGYVVYPYDSAVQGYVSYPKFRTDYETHISLKHGVFDTREGGSYDRQRLKFINIPVLKSHHSTYGATVCMKNYMGVVTGALDTNSHNAIRYGIMGALVGEIQLADLNIIDAIWINANPYTGPSTTYAGATRRDELVASVDPIAADIWVVKNILTPSFVANGYPPPWPQPDADPDNPTSDFRQYLDNSMYQILSAGYEVTNDLGQVDLFTWRGGDFDGDVDVDLDDYDQFALCFTGSGGEPVTAECAVGDLDFDEDIDCNDWTLFTGIWTGPGDPPDIGTCTCIGSDPATAEPEPITAKNRFVSFMPGNAGQQTALRVTLTSLPSPFSECDGTQLWVGQPSAVTEASGSYGPVPEPTFMAARLQEEPYHTDWGSLGTIHVYGHAIVPSGSYAVQAISQGCDTANEPSYSASLSVSSSARWGDLVGDCGSPPCTPPDGIVDFIDISGVVDKFRNLPNAPIKARADLAGDLPDLVVDFVDISYAVDAFRGAAYPFDGPGPCD